MLISDALTASDGKNAPWRIRYCHVDRADTGVKVAVAIPVSVVDPLGGYNPVFSPADGISLGREGSG